MAEASRLKSLQLMPKRVSRALARARSSPMLSHPAAHPVAGSPGGLPTHQPAATRTRPRVGSAIAVRSRRCKDTPSSADHWRFHHQQQTPMAPPIGGKAALQGLDTRVAVCMAWWRAWPRTPFHLAEQWRAGQQQWSCACATCCPRGSKSFAGVKFPDRELTARQAQPGVHDLRQVRERPCSTPEPKAPGVASASPGDARCGWRRPRSNPSRGRLRHHARQFPPASLGSPHSP